MKQTLRKTETNPNFDHKLRMKAKGMDLSCTRCSPGRGHNKNPKRDNSKSNNNPKRYKKIKAL